MDEDREEKLLKMKLVHIPAGLCDDNNFVAFSGSTDKRR